jgi:hypothetical protein
MFEKRFLQLTHSHNTYAQGKNKVYYIQNRQNSENIGMIGMCFRYFLLSQNFVDFNVIHFVFDWGSIGRVSPKEEREGFFT